MSFKENMIYQVTDVVPMDSGSYECRVMVRETVSISHTLLVSQSSSVQALTFPFLVVVITLFVLLLSFLMRPSPLLVTQLCSVQEKTLLAILLS